MTERFDTILEGMRLMVDVISRTKERVCEYKEIPEHVALDEENKRRLAQ
jgi:hypothetical protein